jgi:hypothetical protein
MCTKFWLESLNERDQSEDTGLDGRINIRLCLKETGWEVVEWMHLAQDKDKWWGSCENVCTLEFHKRQEI